MVFSDPVFVFYFLPVVLIAYWILPLRTKPYLVAMSGAVFYFWGGHELLSLIILTIVGNYIAGNFLGSSNANQDRSKSVLALAIALNLVSLCFWKYANFGVSQVESLLRLINIHVTWQPEILLPIGISFYTFQSISYVVDIYRGITQPASSFVSFSSYILLFPHLIAGPIVRFSDIQGELNAQSRNRLDDLYFGLSRFFWGLGKKVLIADQVALLSSRVFGLPATDISTGVAWLGAISYLLQIYYDFSGYSDMAIGLARMFGFKFRENFERPYSASSVTEFWRRWHISLSTWFRDYLYIPLGGNKRGNSRTYRNLCLVFIATGIWHGANWTFVIWGAYHGLLLIVERFRRTDRSQGVIRTYLARLKTIGLVMVGWVIFRSDSVNHAWSLLVVMFSPTIGAFPIEVAEVFTLQRTSWMIIGLVPVLFAGKQSIGSRLSHSSSGPDAAIRFMVFAIWAPLALLYSLSTTFSPFLYFQF